MRPVLLGELDVAARALLSVPASDRPARMMRILCAAEDAERFLARTGRYHPRHGNGSLSSAARGQGIVPTRAVCDHDYLAALICVLQALEGQSGVPIVPHT